MPAKPTLTLIAYIFVLMPGMLLGLYFARRKMFVPHHKAVMTTVTLVNWALIIWLMLGSYATGVLPNLPERLLNPMYLLPTIHLLTGAIAQLLATYLVILMWTEHTRFERLLPIRIRNIKTPMRVTLGLWLTTIILGVAIFAVWYAAPTNAAAEPISTEEPLLTATEQVSDDNTAPAATDDGSEDSAAPAAPDDGSADSAVPAATEASGS